MVTPQFLSPVGSSLVVSQFLTSTLVCEIEQRRFEGRRVLVVSRNTISRNVTVAIAYLTKYGGMSLKDSWKHVKSACMPMQPSWEFMEMLSEFEAQCNGKDTRTLLTEEEFYGKRMRQFCPQSQERLPKVKP
ncbi:unnamed protein product [Echinostoma caproni]|uniref:protein-tyrosine-phosphatase n=1 Tax=Echinostoma caproni TaxID=27848 RepID=A0A3P8GEH5_9TREM|nr:unnamed protein product [Echinostoma caproni]